MTRRHQLPLDGLQRLRCEIEKATTSAKWLGEHRSIDSRGRAATNDPNGPLRTTKAERRQGIDHAVPLGDGVGSGIAVGLGNGYLWGWMAASAASVSGLTKITSPTR